MKIVRVLFNGEVFYGEKVAGSIFRLRGDIFEGAERDGREYDASYVKLLAPVMPSKVVAIGKNYHAHAMEMQEGEPAEPLLFLKPNTCVIGHGDVIEYPAISNRVDYEGELCVVIGRKCRLVSEEDALDYVFGYSCLNDVTARDIQKSDAQWTRGKGFDTFCPIGPHIETELCCDDLRLQTRVNGEVRQDSRTSCMTHSVTKLISYISQVMTLLPGDCIATGTPEGIGPMNCGDSVEVEIEGIGILQNELIRRE